MNTILEINKILKEQNKDKNTKNIIEQSMIGGKHAFDVIKLVHETEVDFYKQKIKTLEERIRKLENQYSDEQIDKRLDSAEQKLNDLAQSKNTDNTKKEFI